MTIGIEQRTAPGGVVVADSSGLRRESLVLGLRSCGVEVSAAVATGVELLPAIRRHRPAVVLLDADLQPEPDGDNPAARVVAERPGCGVLVLAHDAGPEELGALLSLREPARGVGLLLRDRVDHLTALVEALRRVRAGEVVVDPDLVSTMLRARTETDPLAVLTPRERDVLRLMAQGFSNGAVARSLCMATKTVEKNITAINQKLGLAHHDHDAELNTRVLAVLAYLGRRPAPVG